MQLLQCALLFPSCPHHKIPLVFKLLLPMWVGTPRVTPGWIRKDTPYSWPLIPAMFPLAAVRRTNTLVFFNSMVSSRDLLLVWNQLVLCYGPNCRSKSVCNTRLHLQLLTGHGACQSQTEVLTLTHSAYSVSALYNTNLERTTGKEITESGCLKEQWARVTITRGKTSDGQLGGNCRQPHRTTQRVEQ